jgi:hypothetical protein
MVSHNQLKKRKTLPRSVVPWTLDSGAFMELSTHGKWLTTTHDYIQSVQWYNDEIGNLVWAAPQDYMCEPWILEKTGLTTQEHQQRTIDNYRDLMQHAPELPWIPVIQGWELDDYHRHVDEYDKAGVDLDAQHTVGVGSVCRRQSTIDAANIIRSLWAQGVKNLHGFGFKKTGIKQAGPLMASADSMAWSFGARRLKIKLPECTHKLCTACLQYATQWRNEVISGIPSTLQIPLL